MSSRLRILGVFLFLGTAGWAQVAPPRQVTAPLPSLGGEEVRLDDVAGEAVLLAFVRIQADPTARVADASRAGLLQLKSLARQYEPEGLRLFLVTPDVAERAALENFVNDWGLKGVPLLLDEQGEAALAYGVSQFPTVFLIGAEGHVSARWEGATEPAELAFAVRRALGLSP